MNESNPRLEQQERWLKDAARALAEAERMTGLLALSLSRDDLTLAALQAQIMVLRGEIERLQRDRSGGGPRKFDPKWIEISAWTVPPGR